ncbi:hypothetical protein CFE70_010455 [Pyrenophora teres f. teres 0-1]
MYKVQAREPTRWRSRRAGREPRSSGKTKHELQILSSQARHVTRQSPVPFTHSLLTYILPSHGVVDYLVQPVAHAGGESLHVCTSESHATTATIHPQPHLHVVVDLSVHTTIDLSAT